MSRACPLCDAPEARDFAEVAGRRYLRCEHCCLTFLDPTQLPSRHLEGEVYDHHQNDPADPRYRAFLDRLVAPLGAHLKPGMVGLDFGCGPGPTIAVMLAERGIEVVDYDPLYRPTAGALERRYDFITCTEVVEHLHAPGRELTVIDRLLKPGAWLGVMTEIQDDDAAFATWWYLRDPTHVAFYRQETMAWIAQKFGWQLTFPSRTVALFHKPDASAHNP